MICDVAPVLHNNVLFKHVVAVKFAATPSQHSVRSVLIEGLEGGFPELTIIGAELPEVPQELVQVC
jgi:hypothetical protein